MEQIQKFMRDVLVPCHNLYGMAFIDPASDQGAEKVGMLGMENIDEYLQEINPCLLYTSDAADE